MRFSSFYSRLSKLSPRNGINLRGRAYASMQPTQVPVNEFGEPFTFREEPLGLPASGHWGYYQGQVGDVLAQGLFKLEAKLGWGSSSSVWLARFLRSNSFVTLKILTGAETRHNIQGLLNEAEILQSLAIPPELSPRNRQDARNTISNIPPTLRSKHCISIVAFFMQPGVDPEDGHHLCLATKLMGGTLETVLESSPGQFIPIGTVKRILHHVLLGVVDLHARGIAHTDLKPDNIMFELESSWTTASIDAWLKEFPPRTHPPERSLNKTVRSHVSQNFPQPSLDQLGSRNFRLADFGRAQFVADQTTNNITPLGLRPPEITLGAEWDESVDVWTFGCLAYYFLTNESLVNPVTDQGFSEEHISLHQMACFADDSFTPGLLQRCTRASQYFNSDGTHKYQKEGIFRKTLEQHLLEDRPQLSPEDISGAAGLLTKCLRIDARNRATAEELLKDPWLSA